MLGNRLEQSIIGIYNKDISLVLSINQISKKLNKAYPHINTKANELIEEGVLNKVEIGRSYQCAINLESEKAISLLNLNEIDKRERYYSKRKISRKFIQEIDEIKNKFKTYTVIISSNKLIFVLDHIYDKEAIKNQFKEIKNFDLIFFTKEEFVDFIVDNLEAHVESIILYSPTTYFEILSTLKDNLFVRGVSR